MQASSRCDRPAHRRLHLFLPGPGNIAVNGQPRRSPIDPHRAVAQRALRLAFLQSFLDGVQFPRHLFQPGADAQQFLALEQCRQPLSAAAGMNARSIQTHFGSD